MNAPAHAASDLRAYRAIQNEISRRADALLAAVLLDSKRADEVIEHLGTSIVQRLIDSYRKKDGGIEVYTARGLVDLAIDETAKASVESDLESGRFQAWLP